MFQLAHISDVHLAPLPKPTFSELCGKRLTGYINWKKTRQQEMESAPLAALLQDLNARQPNHLLISGDLVNLSLDQEFKQARDWLIKQGAARDISLTFGNHDAYVRGSFQKACNIFRPWIKGDEAQGWSSAFPYMRVRDNVAIIGTSSAIATPPFQAAGYFDSTQAHHLSDLLAEAAANNLFRIVMIHHPPLHHATHWHKKLWGIDRFQNVIRTMGANLVVHGHTHVPSLQYIYGPEGKVPVVGVASASQAFGGKKPPANYNWFTIQQNKNYEKNQSRWSCLLERHTIINDANDIAVTESVSLI